MAGHRQYRELAGASASAGIEREMTRIVASGAPGTATVRVTTSDSVTVTRYVGDESVLLQSSTEKLIGRHYVIESTGRSLREASDSQAQGVVFIDFAAGVARYGRLGGGLVEGTP